MSYNACCTGLSFSKANECITIVSKCEVRFYKCHDFVNAKVLGVVLSINDLASMFHCSKQTIFIEYIMLDGVNDQEEHAHKLGKLLENFKAVR